MIRHRILVAEDEPLLGFALRDMLAAAGFEVLGPYGKVGDALEAATGAPPSFAVVDMMLADDSALPLADYLSERDIPYVIVSGLGQPEDGHYRGGSWIEKPFDSAQLLAVIDRALVARAAMSDDVPPAVERGSVPVREC